MSAMDTDRLSANFARAEFACRGVECCGGSAPVHPDLITLIQDIRDAVGVPICITSGFRCRTHNARTKGAAPDSYHTLGMAADIHTHGAVSLARLLAVSQAVIRQHGYGWCYYKRGAGIIHVDCRPAK